MIFRRSYEKNFLESCLLKKDIVSGEYHCIGSCRTKPTASEMNTKPELWEYAFFDQSTVFFNDKQTSVYVGQSIVRMENCKDGFQFHFSDSSVYPAVRDEFFNMEDIHPIPPTITENNIGECLKCWNMGCNEEIISINSKNTFIGVTINTEKHMYIFEILPTSIYCRAARYRTCNKGVIFNQNFRQSSYPETYMIEDNYGVLVPLLVDENLFNSNTCAWNSRSVYWSVSSFTEDQIVLNGCQGDIYKWNKPDR